MLELIVVSLEMIVGLCIINTDFVDNDFFVVAELESSRKTYLDLSESMPWRVAFWQLSGKLLLIKKKYLVSLSYQIFMKLRLKMWKSMFKLLYLVDFLSEELWDSVDWS